MRSKKQLNQKKHCHKIVYPLLDYICSFFDISTDIQKPIKIFKKKH